MTEKQHRPRWRRACCVLRDLLLAYLLAFALMALCVFLAKGVGALGEYVVQTHLNQFR